MSKIKYLTYCWLFGRALSLEWFFEKLAVKLSEDLYALSKSVIESHKQAIEDLAYQEAVIERLRINSLSWRIREHQILLQVDMDATSKPALDYWGELVERVMAWAEDLPGWQREIIKIYWGSSVNWQSSEKGA